MCGNDFDRLPEFLSNGKNVVGWKDESEFTLITQLNVIGVSDGSICSDPVTRSTDERI